MLSEELCVLSSCFFSPLSKNSVLEELRVRRLAVYIYVYVTTLKSVTIRPPRELDKS